MTNVLPPWGEQNPSGLLKPSDDLINNGFKSTTIGNNLWLNWILNKITIHAQVQVGVIKTSFVSTLDQFLPLKGDTFGNASSLANYSSDLYEDLFLLLWGNSTVSPSKGSSAEDDWAANKQITLPDASGCQLRMAKSGENLLSVYQPDGETNTLNIDVMPVMTPTITDPGHTHDIATAFNVTPDGPLVPRVWDSTESLTNTTLSSQTGITIDPLGGQSPTDPTAAPHNNVPPTIITNFFIKY